MHSVNMLSVIMAYGVSMVVLNAAPRTLPDAVIADPPRLYSALPEPQHTSPSTPAQPYRDPETTEASGPTNQQRLLPHRTRKSMARLVEVGCAALPQALARRGNKHCEGATA